MPHIFRTLCTCTSFAIVLCFASTAHPEAMCTNIEELISQIYTDKGKRTDFKLSGIILDSYKSPAFFCNGYAITLWLHGLTNNVALHPGDHIIISGTCANRTFYVKKAKTIPATKAPFPKPDAVSPRQILQGRYANRLVETQGLVTDVFQDDIDAHFVYLVIQSDGAQIYAAIHKNQLSNDLLQNLLDAEIRIRGICKPPVMFQRPYSGCIIRSLNVSTLKITKPATTDPLSFPELLVPPYATPQEINVIGKRHIRGTVIAVSADNTFLIRDFSGLLHRITPVGGRIPPKIFDVVVAGGTVRTDFYLINLSQAIYTVVGHVNNPTTEPLDVSASDILCGKTHTRQIIPKFYGKTIRLKGRVTKPHSTLHGTECLFLDCDSVIVPVDVVATGLNPVDISLGSTVSATGLCLMDVENWSPTVPFPKIKGFTLVAQKANDIRILAHPPWWTPVKFFGVIMALLSILVGSFIWNRSLKFLVNRRSRELLREQVSHASAILKAEERTRLSVELHDSLSQNLAGVACQIDTAEYALHEDPPSTAAHLTTAKRMLQSCQQELKRCLFDLRCDALNEDDLGEAIRTTLKPVIGSARLALRFNVPRAHLLDTTAHALICIIRELASNAVRHGHATKLYVAGDLTDDLLSFSVRDNGTGFDRMASPGPGEGHFGLQGIRDRVDRLHGVFSMESSTAGTYAKITIHLSNKTAKAPL